MRLLVFLLVGASNALGQPYVISTVAGGAPPPTPLAAVNASLSHPAGVATDSSGNLYFTSNHTVFKVDATGILTRVAGNSRGGYSGDGGPAISAQLNGPGGIAVDTSGNIYIADAGNNRVRKVTTDGNIATVAGNGTAGYSGDNTPATGSSLNNPVAVALDSAGNLYIADSYNQRIRKVSGGTITTVAGNGTCCYSGENVPATQAQLHQPDGIAVDTSGNIYIADLGNNRIRKVSPAGMIVTVVGNGTDGTAGDGGPATSAQLHIVLAVATDSGGNLYIGDAARVRKVTGSTINTIAGSLASGFAGDGGAATKAQLDEASGVSVDASGNLYIADTGNNRIRKVASSGVIATFAGSGMPGFSGDGGAATSAQMYSPQSAALDSAGNLYIADYARIRKVSGGTINTVAGNGIDGYSGDSGPATSALLNGPEGIAIDASGNLYIADSANNRIRKVSGGTIATFAGTQTAGFSGDNGAATSAQLNDPEGVAVDAAGNVYIADSGNDAIRKVSTSGTITTVAGTGQTGFSGDGGPATSAQLSYPRGVTVDSLGNLYIADFGNGRVRKVSNGTITTVAGNGLGDSSGNGGPPNSAGLSPQGVASDTAGNLYIADFNNLVWKVSNGIINRIAGTGTSGYTGDGGSALGAQLTDIRNLTVDPNGNVYFADTSNNAVRFLRNVTVLLSIATPPPLPGGGLNAPYSQQFAATGGTPPYNWSIAAGALPPGLTLTAAGSLGGSPTATGTYTFTVQVADNISSTATQSYTISVTVPAITTNSPLLQGTVGLNYSQTLTATGGALPYTWVVSSGSLPPGLMLSPSGVISGIPTAAGAANFSVKLTDAAQNTATQNYILVVSAALPVTRSGVLAHIAAGGDPSSMWTTTIYLANTSPNQVAVALSLHADDGSALVLPMTVTQQGATQSVTASSLNSSLGPNSTLVIDTGEQVAATVTGWVDVASSGPLSGFAIFRTLENGLPSEGTAPLQTQFESRIDVPYDNRSGFVTAAALANLSASAATVTATIYDPNGAQLGTQTISLPASGHASFLVPTLFPATAGQQGIVQFQSSAGNLAGVGLRASPLGTFTSIPVVEP